MTSKKEAREFCLQFIYHFQLPVFKDLKANIDSSEIFERVQEFRETINLQLDTNALAFVSSMVRGILEHYEEIEEILTKFLKNWKLSRISRVEHSILMMAIYELRYHPEVSGKVVINEAIELGKKYSTKESAGFINGILDNIYKSEPKPHE